LGESGKPTNAYPTLADIACSGVEYEPQEYTTTVGGGGIPLSSSRNAQPLAGRFPLDDSPPALAERQEKKHGVFFSCPIM